MKEYKINVNGQLKNVKVHDDTPLLWVLRDHCSLTGTKYGCGIAQCGACTVHVDGKAVRSCQLPISLIGDSKVTTIENVENTKYKILQEAWTKYDVPQCGYCQAGQIMQAASFLERNSSPTDAEIDEAMAGNLCRCGTYLRIKSAIKEAAKNL